MKVTVTLDLEWLDVVRKMIFVAVQSDGRNMQPADVQARLSQIYGLAYRAAYDSTLSLGGAIQLLREPLAAAPRVTEEGVERTTEASGVIESAKTSLSNSTLNNT